MDEQHTIEKIKEFYTTLNRSTALFADAEARGVLGPLTIKGEDGSFLGADAKPRYGFTDEVIASVRQGDPIAMEQYFPGTVIYAGEMMPLKGARPEYPNHLKTLADMMILAQGGAIVHGNYSESFDLFYWNAEPEFAKLLNQVHDQKSLYGRLIDGIGHTDRDPALRAIDDYVARHLA